VSGEIEVVEGADATDERERGSAVAEPGKLLRIAVMLREMQEEVRRSPTDDAGLERLTAVHGKAVEQLCDALSGDLRDELSELALPLSDTPTEGEVRIAQAQLVGWLEGLFQGIQAAIASQQMMARQQLEQLRGRSLPPGAAPLPGGQAAGSGAGPAPGQYL
jgi:hypothetical protein